MPAKQLEYSEPDLSYRDIYFGMAFFVGQETVTANERTIWSMSQTWCSTIFRSRSMELTSFLAGSLRPPGGWKCTPLGESICVRCGAARQAAGATPYARRNARVNASLDE